MIGNLLSLQRDLYSYIVFCKSKILITTKIKLLIIKTFI